jgi:hypothetical protein
MIRNLQTSLLQSELRLYSTINELGACDTRFCIAPRYSTEGMCGAIGGKMLVFSETRRRWGGGENNQGNHDVGVIHWGIYQSIA